MSCDFEVRRSSTNTDQRGVKHEVACCDGTVRCHIDRAERRVDKEKSFAAIWDS